MTLERLNRRRPGMAHRQQHRPEHHQTKLHREQLAEARQADRIHPILMDLRQVPSRTPIHLRLVVTPAVVRSASCQTVLDRVSAERSEVIQAEAALPAAVTRVEEA